MPVSTKSHIGLYYNQVLSSSRYYNNNNLPDDYLLIFYQYGIGSVQKFYPKIPFVASFGGR